MNKEEMEALRNTVETATKYFRNNRAHSVYQVLELALKNNEQEVTLTRDEMRGAIIALTTVAAYKKVTGMKELNDVSSLIVEWAASNPGVFK